jgi:hypothetical protein
VLAITSLILAIGSGWQINFKQVDISAGSKTRVLTIGLAAASADTLTLDYTCNGTSANNTSEFQTALGVLTASGGGKLEIRRAGNYAFTTTVNVTDNITIEGVGLGTYLYIDGSTTVLDAGTSSGCVFRDFATDAGGIDVSSATNWIWQNIKIGSALYDYRTPYTVSNYSTTNVTNLISDNFTSGGFSPFGFLGWDSYVISENCSMLLKGFGNFLHWLGWNVWVCDGIDDNVEWQEAIDALPAYEYGTGCVKATGGDFSISAGVEVRAGLTVSGAGCFNTRLVQAAACNILQYTGADTIYFVTIEHLGIFGKKTTYAAGSGIDLELKCADGLLYDLYIERFKSRNVNVGTWNWRIIDCKSEFSDSYGFRYGSDITNCHSMYNYGGFYVSNAKMTGCYAWRNTSYGINIDGDEGGVVNCSIESNWENGTASRGQIELTSDCDGIRIIGNWIDCSNYTTPGSESTYGILINAGSNNVTVIGNDIKNWRAGGSAVSNSGTSCIVKDNIGYETESSGNATITAAATTVVVSHGLSTTPTRVFISPTLLSLSNKAWVTSAGSSNFTINVDIAPGAGTATFNWWAKVGDK